MASSGFYKALTSNHGWENPLQDSSGDERQEDFQERADHGGACKTLHSGRGESGDITHQVPCHMHPGRDLA